MHEIAFDLLILLAGIWLVAVTLRPLGLPTVMGELIVGVLVGPAVLGLITPGEAIQLLAEIGIFFLMFHAGVETQPNEFFDALKRSMGVAIVGAIVPFSVSFGIALAFGLDFVGATFVGLTMTATAVVVTLKSLRDLGLSNTRVARVIIASGVIDALLTLVFFGLVIGVLSGDEFEPLSIVITLGKVIGFFAVCLLIGLFVYPLLKLPFRSEGGKGFTFVLLTAIAAGLFAEAIGLHMILGAYLAGLLFEEKVAHPNLVKIVNDRAYGIAYSFLGPIFFISLGFSITFDISLSEVVFIVLLTTAVIVGQILSAGGMALRMGLPKHEALTVGVGMCGRAEMAFILASLALAQGAIDQDIFTILIFTAFLLNLFTPLALKGCAVLLEGKATRQANASRGMLQIDKFNTPLVEERFDGRLPHTLPEVEDGVVIYGYGPQVDSLMHELESREIPTVVIEEDETVARRLLEREVRVVHAALAQETLDLRPLVRARALVANGKDDHNALFALGAREQGFGGPIVAMIENPNRRAPMMLAGATAAFTPSHILAAVIAARASSRIGPRVAGVEPLGGLLEVAELRVHSASPLANSTLAEAKIRTQTGANIVGQWLDDSLHSPPAADHKLQPGTILVAAGSPESIRRLSEMARPITQEGPLVVVGFGDVGQKLAEILHDAAEEVSVIAAAERPGVDVVGDVLDTRVLERASVKQARVVILALESDSATLLAATVIRDYAPDVPIIASVTLVENVGRVQRAGVDFALSVSQVSGQILAHHVLGETISHQPRIKLVKLRPSQLAGRNPLDTRMRERTGCSVVAVERDHQVLMDIPPSFVLSPDDALYLCGTPAAFNRYYEQFPESRQ
jgi:Kef-type K+ transport system membrane component KefB/Trk K+ transport system NAD-binding subunit